MTRPYISTLIRLVTPEWIFDDGEQARAMDTDDDYDLVILDLNLPRMD